MAYTFTSVGAGNWSNPSTWHTNYNATSNGTDTVTITGASLQDEFHVGTSCLFGDTTTGVVNSVSTSGGDTLIVFTTTVPAAGSTSIQSQELPIADFGMSGLYSDITTVYHAVVLDQDTGSQARINIDGGSLVGDGTHKLYATSVVLAGSSPAITDVRISNGGNAAQTYLTGTGTLTRVVDWDGTIIAAGTDACDLTCVDMLAYNYRINTVNPNSGLNATITGLGHIGNLTVGSGSFASINNLTSDTCHITSVTINGAAASAYGNMEIAAYTDDGNGTLGSGSTASTIWFTVAATIANAISNCTIYASNDLSHTDNVADNNVNIYIKNKTTSIDINGILISSAVASGGSAYRTW